MKVLSGLEHVLNKLEEWEVYASKSLNSCTEEITLIKQLVIRYRKLQIMSWRNLLQWKKREMVEEDCRENYLRLAHTLERQVFDCRYYKEEEVEGKVMEILDLFMRDSSLGQF
jgi:midasin (ATPase involved in ribosome maturation)